MNVLDQWDPELAAIVHREEERHRRGLELIASENYASAAVLAALATVLNNKYAEGYPGRRYYGGCQYVDEVEELAISRAKQLFGADHVNVQSHSGAEANRAVYTALMEPGDVAMGMDLAQGGHMTHGLNVNFSGKLYRFVHYGVDRETELLDYDQMARLARECRPKVIVVGATAYPRIIDFARCREVADEVGAYLMADIAHIAGLVATGIHPSPVGHAHVITTTTHKTLRGPRGAMIMCQDDLAHTKVDDQLARAVNDQLPAMRDSLVAVCKETKFTVAVRSCLTQAVDHTAFAACETQLTEDQRRALDRATRGEGPSK